MGFEVHVVVTLPKFAGDALMAVLNDKFGEATHEAGTRIVRLTEHVSTSNEGDAEEFVRALVLDAVPPGSKITELTSVPG